MANRNVAIRKVKNELTSRSNAAPPPKSAEWILADVSGSMGTFLPNSSYRRRIDALNDAIAEQGSNVQVMSFSDLAKHIPANQPLSVEGGTCLYPALAQVEAYEPSYIVVVSDGKLHDWTDITKDLVVKLAQYCVIDALYIGLDDEYAEGILRELADLGNGRMKRYDITKSQQRQLTSAVQAFLPPPDDADTIKL